MQNHCARNLLGRLALVLTRTLVVVCALSLFGGEDPQLLAQENVSKSSLRTQVEFKTTSPSLAKAMETRGDLSLQDATIEKALFTIGASWRVNIVVGKDVKGTVSCVYHDAPLREVLDAILLANGYSYRAVGESLVVQKVKEVGSANPLFQSAAIPIVHGDLKEIAEAAGLLISSQGQLRALNSSSSLLVVDFADRVASVREFVSQMEGTAAKASGGIPSGSFNRLQAAYFHTQYIPVDNAKEPVSVVLSQLGRVATMPAENRLVVVDYAANLDMVRKVLEKIDRPRPQVRITALIYDISLADVEQLGLNWNSVGKGDNLDANGDPQQSLTFDTQTLAPFTAGSAGGTMTIKSLTRNFDINTVGLFLQNANDSRLLADPNVTVVQNEIAEWKSVSEIPFQQITQSELGGQIGTTAFKEVGITLRVRAAIASDGTIEMLVEPGFSRVSGFTENDNQPIIDTRRASTIVRIANRQTLVIGGLRQRSDTGDFNGIPFLKDVRYIGPLFRSRNTNVRESELIVFIMPEIVDYDEPLHARDYLAQETIHCRLDRVPLAEGCETPGARCDSPRTAGGAQHELVQLPDVDQQLLLEASQSQRNRVAHPALKDTTPFRAGFQDRYRATTGSRPR